MATQSKFKKGQQVHVKGPTCNDIAPITKVTKEGFYYRRKSQFPTVPGGRTYKWESKFVSFANIDNKLFEVRIWNGENFQ